MENTNMNTNMSTEMVELLIKADDNVKIVNKAIADDVYSDIIAAKAKLKIAVEKYNEAAKKEAYNDYLNRPDNEVFIHALKNAYYDAKSVSYKPDSMSKTETASLEDVEELVNLIELEDVDVRQLSVNGQWRYWLEKFTKLMTARVVADIGDANDMKRFISCYKISAKADSCDMGKTPTSNAQTVKALQTIVDGIVFNDNGKGLNTYKVTTKDVKYIEYLMCGKGKARRSISTPRFSTMLKLLTTALSRIILEGDYAVEFEESKKK